ncbi:MAG: hypothetical protein R3300_19220 [Candidatus Promineifilaceae bacterium]|nr:hypothetical protein [Candidatus Promineifilaceae bacterium]
MNREFVTRLENWASILFFVLGTVFSVLALAAELVGLDLTPGFGMIQMAQLLLGLTMLTLAGYLRVHSERRRDAPRSLQADIGVRLGATGLVFAYVSGLADLIGIGTHVDPSFERPFVGPLQLGGLLIGVLAITAGLLLYYTSRGSRETSSLKALIPESD